MNPDLQLRRGMADDQDWLFELFRRTMQNHIDKAWGWDELLQREGFTTTLPARNFWVLLCNRQRAGSYHLTEKSDHLLLDMILVAPEFQRQGMGRLLMQQVQARSREINKPVQLSVLKTNPAMQFHLASGFTLLDEDSHSARMIWSD